MKLSKRTFFVIYAGLFLIGGMINAQEFTKITSPGNPIASTEYKNRYAGAAWADYDNDGRLDLFVSHKGMTVSSLK